MPDASATLVGPTLAGSVTGVTGLTGCPGNNYTGLTYAQALKNVQSPGHIRIMFESGAAKGEPAGAPAAALREVVHVAGRSRAGR